MRTIIFALALAALTHAALADPSEQTHRRSLHEPQSIQGYPCAQGYA